MTAKLKHPNTVTIYDYGRMRETWLVHLCTDWMGDDAWLAAGLAHYVTRLITGTRQVFREGDGTVNQLIYGELGDSFMTNLQNASDDIAFLTKEAREGKGTIGALLTDPSVYEDIKRLVGDLERNDILRALVRYSIRRDEARDPVEVTEQ